MNNQNTQPSHSGIRDNHAHGKVGDFLREKIQTGSKLSIVSAYFTIYAYEALKDKLDNIESLRFLFGEPRFVKSLDPDKKAYNLEDNSTALANRFSSGLNAPTPMADTSSLEGEIEHTQRVTPRQLYGLSEDEVKILEGR